MRSAKASPTVSISRASDMSVTSTAAIFYDGLSSQRRDVILEMGTGLDIIENGVRIARWEWGTIRRADAPAGTMRLRALGATELARLEIPESAATQEIVLKAFALDVGNESKGKFKIVAWSLGAAASIGFLIFYGVPLAADRLTPLIPLSFEARIGEMVEK